MNFNDYIAALDQLLKRSSHGGARTRNTGFNTYSPSLPPGMADTGADFDIYPSRAASVANNRNSIIGYAHAGNTYSPSLPPGMADTGADFDIYPSRAASVANNRDTMRAMYGGATPGLNVAALRALAGPANARGKRWR